MKGRKKVNNQRNKLMKSERYVAAAKSQNV